MNRGDDADRLLPKWLSYALAFAFAYAVFMLVTSGKGSAVNLTLVFVSPLAVLVPLTVWRHRKRFLPELVTLFGRLWYEVIVSFLKLVFGLVMALLEALASMGEGQGPASPKRSPAASARPRASSPGPKKTLERVDCPTCWGKGRGPCQRCNGTGYVAGKYDVFANKTCPRCRGTRESNCLTCRGTGKVRRYV